ncbi:MAG TPA: polysaccharide pyruvyl transferase family protein [Candidatus Butyricimonas faecavium]|nr:polysaccharide pyruvyl transferase family protein [Candidatus Butyricimonas faecavium]
MKIGILTFHCAHNYGAMLQCYALQEYMKRHRHEVYVIDYRPNYLLKGYLRHSFRHWCSKNPLRAIKKLISEPLLYRDRGIRWDAFDEFMKTKFNLYPYDPLSDYSDFDLLLLGSDQIWSYSITGGQFDPVFFGQGFKCCKVTYAASMSPILLSDRDRKTLSCYLHNIDVISVREAALAEEIHTFVDNEIRVVCDPVFLLENEEWENFCIPLTIKRPYVLCYNIQESEDCNKLANQISRELGYDLFYITPCLTPLKFGHHYLQTLSPIEFVSYIRQAAFVITSSFHGTVFSVVFKKPFYTIGMGNKAGRVTSFLEKIGLSNRLLLHVPTTIDVEIDYARVGFLLERYRGESMEFLDFNKDICESVKYQEQ